MDRFIKGPWQRVSAVFVDDCLGRTVCLPNADTEEEREAKASLIAAAPEMYEALEEALDWILDFVPESKAGPIVERIETALKKAESPNA